MADPSDLLTIAQVAAYLQLNKLTVYKYVRDGRIPAAKIGKAYRIRRADLEMFLDRQKLRPAARRAEPPPRAVPAPKHSEEIAVSPPREERVDARERDLARNDPLEWVIRGLH